MYNDTRDEIIKYHSWMKTTGILAIPVYIAGSLATKYLDLPSELEDFIGVVKFAPSVAAVTTAISNMHTRFRGREETRYGLNGPRPRPPVGRVGHP